jgi:hypothetical protein
MKTFFHPLLISWIITLPLFSQASTETEKVNIGNIPQGYIMTIHSISSDDPMVNILDNFFTIHVRRSIGKNKIRANGEHYKFDLGSFELMKSGDKKTRIVETAIFLPQDALIGNKNFQLCFESAWKASGMFTNSEIPEICSSVPFQDKAGVLDVKDGPNILATVGYTVRRAIITEIKKDEITSSDLVLMRLNQIKLNNKENVVMDSERFNSNTKFVVEISAESKNHFSGYFGSNQNGKDQQNIMPFTSNNTVSDINLFLAMPGASSYFVKIKKTCDCDEGMESLNDFSIHPINISTPSNFSASVLEGNGDTIISIGASFYKVSFQTGYNWRQQ